MAMLSNQRVNPLSHGGFSDFRPTGTVVSWFFHRARSILQRRPEAWDLPFGNAGMLP